MEHQEGQPTRQQRRAAAREVAKELIRGQPSEAISRGDWVLWFLAAAMALALTLAAPKLGAPATAIGLILIFVFLAQPISHLPWIKTAPSVSKKWWRLFGCLAAEGVLVTAFGLWVWPEPAARSIPVKTQQDMATRLRNHPGTGKITVLIEGPNEQETFDYAVQLTNIFKNAGWDTQFYTVLMGGGRPSVGLTLDAADGENPDAAFVEKIFKEFEVPMTSRLNLTRGIEPLAIHVWHKH